MLLQKSQKAQRLIFRQKTKQATIADHDALRGGFGAASFHLSYAHWQAYICPSSSLVMVPGSHPTALRAW
jgi:hypothetical protein